MSTMSTNYCRVLAVACAGTLITLSDAQAAGASGSVVFHVPAAETVSGESLEIQADVARGWEARLEVRFRPAGGATWKNAAFERRSETDYRAEIPGTEIAPPGIEYYIASVASGAGGAGDTAPSETNHFASAATPHPVRVREAKSVELTEAELERFDHRRAKLRVAGEWVDFGTRTIEGQDVPDRYYRIEADFTYRVLRFPLRAFRLGFTQMLGDTPETARGDGNCAEDGDADCQVDAGFRAGGWAELRWRLSNLVGVDTRILIQATPDGFGFGGRGVLRFGDETATHFSVGSEAITEVGSMFFVKLGWSTVPRFPMAATVELSDYPSAHRDHGIRLIYDVGYEIGHGVRVGVRAGYQARDQDIGGASGGLNATVDF